MCLRWILDVIGLSSSSVSDDLEAGENQYDSKIGLSEEGNTEDEWSDWEDEDENKQASEASQGGSEEETEQTEGIEMGVRQPPPRKELPNAVVMPIAPPPKKNYPEIVISPPQPPTREPEEFFERFGAPVSNDAGTKGMASPPAKSPSVLPSKTTSPSWRSVEDDITDEQAWTNGINDLSLSDEDLDEFLDS